MTIQHKSYLVHWVYQEFKTSREFSNVMEKATRKFLEIYIKMNQRWKYNQKNRKTFYGGILLRMVSDYLK